MSHHANGRSQPSTAQVSYSTESPRRIARLCNRCSNPTSSGSDRPPRTAGTSPASQASRRPSPAAPPAPRAPPPPAGQPTGPPRRDAGAGVESCRRQPVQQVLVVEVHDDGRAVAAETVGGQVLDELGEPEAEPFRVGHRRSLAPERVVLHHLPGLV